MTATTIKPIESMQEFFVRRAQRNALVHKRRLEGADPVQTEETTAELEVLKKYLIKHEKEWLNQSLGRVQLMQQIMPLTVDMHRDATDGKPLDCTELVQQLFSLQDDYERYHKECAAEVKQAQHERQEIAEELKTMTLYFRIADRKSRNLSKQAQELLDENTKLKEDLKQARTVIEQAHAALNDEGFETKCGRDNFSRDYYMVASATADEFLENYLHPKA
jgi:hypothetical protein